MHSLHFISPRIDNTAQVVQKELSSLESSDFVSSFVSVTSVFVFVGIGRDVVFGVGTEDFSCGGKCAIDFDFIAVGIGVEVGG